MAVLDLFAGPGGWDEGVRPLGLDPLGLELDETACATGRAAGHRRECQDVAAADPDWYRPVDGLVASPPCQGFSRAGKERGRPDGARMTAGLAGVHDAAGLRRLMTELRGTMADHRSLLVLQSLRWTLALGPSWTAWEQVPAVLPLWEACAAVLRRHGWSVATGCLQAEQYGVPQTRRRAFLIGRAPWLAARLGPATLPEPTHSRYWSRDPSRLDPGVAPWVSMAQALGWTGRDRVGFPRRADGREVVTVDGTDYRARDLYPATRPTPVLTEKVCSWTRLQLVSNVARGNGTAREMGQPAPAITGGKDHAERQWVRSRPATTVQGDARIWPPGHKVNGDDMRRLGEQEATGRYGDRAGTGATRVSVQEAAVLQSFPPDYPWQGPMTQQYRQVGDAVPPLLALHVVAAATGLALPVADDAEAVA